MRLAPGEGWILAGTLDGRPALPGLLEDLGGITHALRLAGELAFAGVSRITILWCGGGAPPDLDAIARDPRIASRAKLTVATEPPAGDDADAIVVVRADRVFHRDMPKHVIAAWRRSDAPFARIAGDEHDAVFVAGRPAARRLAARAADPGGIAGELAGAHTAAAEVPYLGFTTVVHDARGRRRAERQLVWSLRKSADGIAAKLLNRHISLPITYLLCRTPVHPNHVTVVAFLCALAGAFSLAQGGYLAGVIGMLFVELGSIVDGIDGELARLKFQFSRLGQWLDTTADDLGNIAYATGTAINLHLAGASWALPLVAAAVTAFVLTQGTQYYLIARVYRSGDLAAIPWAFQSSEFLSQRPTGLVSRLKATLPKMLKRDFAVTMFVVFAIAGHLELILLVFSSGALVFFAVFAIQLARNWRSIRMHRA
ncbi:MAG TPA: CDP-alcohol phosphatidyltransferase family protein [Kofleriaceae bacterium]|nr:CDP-alcohol phosphatidyltransferase family protein [Kofleriaceae bacterium]